MVVELTVEPVAEKPKPKKSLQDYIQMITQGKFSSAGHEQLAETEKVNARVADIRNQLFHLSYFPEKVLDRGNVQDWLTLRALYSQSFMAAKQNMSNQEKLAINKIDAVFNLPPTYKL